MARLCTGLNRSYRDILAPYSSPINTLAAGTQRFDPLVPFVVPDFHMLGVELALSALLDPEHVDCDPPLEDCTFNDGSFGFFLEDLVLMVGIQ